MPVTEVFSRPCNVRYHEAAGGGAALVCSCGTFAIGLCADCGKAVCGDCSLLYQSQRLCLQDVRGREDAAALAVVKARLTLERFLTLAAAVGNPGLRTWTIVQLAEKETTRKEGRFRRKTVVRTHIGKVGQYEIRGWALPCYVASSKGRGTPSMERLRELEGMMLTEQGRINKLRYHVNKLGENVAPIGEDLPTFENREKHNESAIEFDYQFSDWRWKRQPGELMDLALRELCRSLQIPISDF